MSVGLSCRWTISQYDDDEDKNANVWQQKAFDVLKFVASKDVDTVDMFRLGRFVTNKVRPVIAKFKPIVILCLF